VCVSSLELETVGIRMEFFGVSEMNSESQSLKDELGFGLDILNLGNLTV
jgi:hypothetical protein